MKMLKILRIFKSKPVLKINLGKVAIIENTENAVYNGLNDKFNKNIVIYEGVRVNGDKIIWGRKIKEVPYTPEEANSILNVLEIPIVEKRLSNDFDFIEGSEFGKVVT